MPIRNQVVRHGAILRKGGAHTSNVSGQRHQSKRQLDDEIDDYFNQSEDPDLNTSDTKGKPTNKGRRNSAPSSLHALFSNLSGNQACA